ncbi:unnamed protein product [Rhizophagus irregularis]|nr:unnamed protein product [Rhizophagus irregularis]
MKLKENVCEKLKEPDLFQKDKIHCKYISEITKIKKSYKEMDEQYKTVEEALKSFSNEKTKKRKVVEAEGIVNFLQTGNERLNDTSKMVHKFQLNFLERNEVKKSRIDEQEKEAKDANKNESVTDNKPYDLREKRNINYNEEYFEEENEDEDEDDDGVIIINDVDELCFKDGDPENDLKIGDNNVSQLFRKYQNESAKIAILIKILFRNTKFKCGNLNNKCLKIKFKSLKYENKV